jgi:hypothetical protein
MRFSWCCSRMATYWRSEALDHDNVWNANSFVETIESYDTRPIAGKLPASSPGRGMYSTGNAYPDGRVWVAGGPRSIRRNIFASHVMIAPR